MFRGVVARARYILGLFASYIQLAFYRTLQFIRPSESTKKKTLAFFANSKKVLRTKCTNARRSLSETIASFWNNDKVVWAREFIFNTIFYGFIIGFIAYVFYDQPISLKHIVAFGFVVYLIEAEIMPKLLKILGTIRGNG